jgi:hypothetical protein
LRLQVNGGYIDERITVHRNSDYLDPAFLDFHGMAISQNLSVNYPGSAQYTMDAGFVSGPYMQESCLQLIIWHSANYRSSRCTVRNRTLSGLPPMALPLPKTARFQTRIPRDTYRQSRTVYT